MENQISNLENPFSENELKVEIEKIALEFYHKGVELFPCNPGIPEIRYELTGVVSGKAFTWGGIFKDSGKVVNWKGYLNFNLPLAMENQDDFLNQTVPHEVAHLIADYFFQACCGHDARWQSVMIRLGKEPMRCHHMAVENHRHERTVTRHEIICKSCGRVYKVSSIYMNKWQSGRIAPHCHCGSHSLKSGETLLNGKVKGTVETLD